MQLPTGCAKSRPIAVLTNSLSRDIYPVLTRAEALSDRSDKMNKAMDRNAAAVRNAFQAVQSSNRSENVPTAHRLRRIDRRCGEASRIAAAYLAPLASWGGAQPNPTRCR
jgi:hypothetical protein